MPSQINLIDFTIPHKDYPTVAFVHGVLRCWFKKYVFQLEKGEKTGYLHWQGRGSLIKKAYHDSIKDKLGFHNSPTSDPAFKQKTFVYVMKEQTRVEGPFTDQDYEEPPVLTRQLRTFMEYDQHPWQKDVTKLIEVPCDRSIIVILDVIGNTGKSVYAEWLEYYRKAYEIPPMRSMEDIMQCAMCIKSQKCYLVDMPRGMDKSKMADFYAGLESLKNGVMYDKRYSFKKRRIDRPHIVVFTNTLPDQKLMSADRWKIFTILTNFTLAQS